MSGAAGDNVAVFTGLDLIFAPVPWPWADARHAEIEAHFAELQRRNPALWNGRVLLMHHYEIVDNLFRGMFLETDFASFCTWSDSRYPPAGVWNCFCPAAIRGSDGGWLLGVMGGHTANAGQVYFPCGTPDLQDTKDDRVDFEHSVARELVEETGFGIADFDAEPNWTVVRTGAFVAVLKVLHARQTAPELRTRILANLARQRDPEFSDIRVVRQPADLDAAMPRFVQMFLKHRWQQE